MTAEDVEFHDLGGVIGRCYSKNLGVKLRLEVSQDPEFLSRIYHFSPPQRGTPSEHVLECELENPRVIRTADLTECIVRQRTVRILGPKAVRQIESFRSKLNALAFSYQESPG